MIGHHLQQSASFALPPGPPLKLSRCFQYIPPQASYLLYEGYKRSSCKVDHVVLPVIQVAVSADKLFEVLMDCLGLLSDNEVQVCLDVNDYNEHRIYNRSMERIILESKLFDYDDYLVHEAYQMVFAAFCNYPRYLEVQLSRAKVITMYVYQPHDLSPIQNMLHAHGITEIPAMQFLSDEVYPPRESADHETARADFAASLGITLNRFDGDWDEDEEDDDDDWGSLLD